MCCALVDQDVNRPGQLAAASLGEDVNSASETALVGVLVSSLHRLKDTNTAGELNADIEKTLLTSIRSDGGFFVFPDVSVRVEGMFRLRFNLFEITK